MGNGFSPVAGIRGFARVEVWSLDSERLVEAILPKV
jgi:hypothetical protein